MSVQVERATISCAVCGAAVSELRRGRCWGCYLRWTETRPVGRGAVCVICYEKRRDQLKLMELRNRSVPTCHGCAARINRLDQLPETIAAIRQALQRDRRQGDRRGDGVDRRIFPRERRVGERRGPPRDARAAAGDSDTLPSLDDVIIELAAADVEVVDQTVVKATPAADET
jgi:hypothetical protein